jgi:hypothetical protein
MGKNFLLSFEEKILVYLKPCNLEKIQLAWILLIISKVVDLIVNSI